VFSTDDTIVAIATPPGRGGIGVVRLSGPQALDVAQQLITDSRRLEPRRATLTFLRAPVRADDARPVDQLVATYFAAPASYTGEDVVELSMHGSPVVLTSAVQAAVRCGARLAEPGEFTFRAHLHGRIDLTQAEAIADLVDAVTPLQARAAFDQLQGTLTEAIGRIEAGLFDLIASLEASVDFPEEGYHFDGPTAVRERIGALLDDTTALIAEGRRGRLLRDGFQVAIIGAPNVGKSSLFNRLVGSSRAIVTEVPGTTRDLVSETIDLEGFRVTIVDTAGIRPTSDVVEAEGVARSRRAVEVADVVLMVIDGSDESASAELSIGDLAHERRLVVQNKMDLGVRRAVPGAVATSATTGIGLDVLTARILEALDIDLLEERPAITNVRHIALLERAEAALSRARGAVSDGAALPEEFVLADLQEARAALEEMTGKRTSEDLLAHIFERFCIGK
jgi:tRNA modification GTPase